MKKTLTVLSLAGLAFGAACSDATTEPTAFAPDVPNLATVTRGAQSTTFNVDVDGEGKCLRGSEINCNQYAGKPYVWFSGLPIQAALGEGNYLFAVLVPGGQRLPNDGEQNNLSDDVDPWTNRVFSVNSSGILTNHGTHDWDQTNNMIRVGLAPHYFANTTNLGGVYILAICQIGDLTFGVLDENGRGGVIDAVDYPATAQNCKYDMFKVGAGAFPTASNPTAAKDALGSYTDTYNWAITKDVDRTRIEALSSTATATFNYTVVVTRTGMVTSGVQLGGTITVSNPNGSDIVISSITDLLDTGASCSITGTFPATVTPAGRSFPYTCSLATNSVPTATSNTAMVTWPEQILDNGSLLSAGSTTAPKTITWNVTTLYEEVTVTDTWNGTETTLGTVPPFDEGSAGTKTFTYSKVVSIPASGCQEYTNTAAIVETEQPSDPVTVQACRVPLVTGAGTMGWWSNKNGQDIITRQASSGTCPSTAFLRTYRPFQDLGSKATCAQVGTYVLNVINAANSSGDSMNPMLKGQMLATALNVYFSSPALGGNRINAPTPIGGISIDLTQICTVPNERTCNGSYQNVSSAFGGATSLTVSQMLTHASNQSNSGGSSWYGQVKATQERAKNAFDAINNQAAYQAP